MYAHHRWFHAADYNPNTSETKNKPQVRIPVLLDVVYRFSRGGAPPSKVLAPSKNVLASRLSALKPYDADVDLSGTAVQNFKVKWS